MTNTETTPAPAAAGTARTEPRVVAFEGLKALAHPLRVRIIDTLSIYGEFTASGLAERLGESSGATSYHLRQLEKHGFVREVEGRDTGRERWWERVPGGITISPATEDESPSRRAASRLVLREWETNRALLLRDFIDRGEDVLSREWVESSMITLANLTLTVAQAKQLSERLMVVVDEFADAYR